MENARQRHKLIKRLGVTVVSATPSLKEPDHFSQEGPIATGVPPLGKAGSKDWGGTPATAATAAANTDPTKLSTCGVARTAVIALSPSKENDDDPPQQQPFRRRLSFSIAEATNEIRKSFAAAEPLARPLSSSPFDCPIARSLYCHSLRSTAYGGSSTAKSSVVGSALSGSSAGLGIFSGDKTHKDVKINRMSDDDLKWRSNAYLAAQRGRLKHKLRSSQQQCALRQSSKSLRPTSQEEESFGFCGDSLSCSTSPQRRALHRNRDCDDSLTTSSSSTLDSSSSNEALDLVDPASMPMGNFRCSYLQKLSTTNVWLPQSRRPPKHETIIIFDWDDTILPTAYINARLRMQSPSLEDEEAQSEEAEFRTKLKIIEENAARLLQIAKENGTIFIITNAMKGWVEYSCQIYLPGLVELLRKTHIISARSRFEKYFPGDHKQWKRHAFMEIQQTMNDQIVANLVAIGDSWLEMDAVHQMGKSFEKCLVKKIKYRDSPTLSELAKQLELTADNLNQICANCKNLRIGLEKRSRSNSGVVSPPLRASSKSVESGESDSSPPLLSASVFD